MKTLRIQFQTDMVHMLQKELGIQNVLRVPRLEKVVVNIGFGRLVSGEDKKEQRQQIMKNVGTLLSVVTGQKPSMRQAHKSVASFKVRLGDVIGASVTLRGARMYDFIERLVNIVLPRVRDFRGIAREAVDPRGICTIGLKEHVVFPEVLTEDFGRTFGIGVTLVSTTRNRDYAIALYTLLGIPFKHTK